MIKYIEGDLVRDAEQYDVIAHGANCFCTMGSGIAKSIREKFPEAYEVDCKTKSGDIKKLGTITFTENTKPIVVNCYSQFDFRGRYVGVMDCDYKAIQSAMRLIKKNFTGKKIGLPKIGSQLAGGDWNIINRIIEEELGDENVTIVTYKP